MILVTGGAGFIGSHLVERLARDGRRVVLLDGFDDFYDPALKWRNVEGLLRGGQVELVVGDVRDGRTLERAIGKRPLQAVIHLAARPGVQPSLSDPALYAAINVTGTLRVLEAARGAAVPEVILASSSSVYGDTEPIPFREEASPPRPVSPYGASKLAMEVVARTWAELFGVRVTALRFFTAYGPRQRPDMAIHRFARRIEAGERIVLFGKGDTRRDYTYVEDVVDGIVRCLGRSGPVFREYNLGREDSVSLAALVEALERALGRTAERDYAPEQPGDVRATAADCSRARAELGYAPRVDLEHGIAEFVRWLRRAG